MAFLYFILALVTIEAIERTWARRQNLAALKEENRSKLLELEAKKVDKILSEDPDLFDLRN
jgi:hypothetical protein